jgi:putative ABC transport system ATP-binding protein
MNVIKMQGVQKDYPLGNTTVRALKHIDFTVQKGDFLSIVGPSGSGKTTMLNLIGCIDHPTAGTLHIHGTDVTTMSDKQLTDLRLERIGFIFQTFNLIPVLSVRENVEFPLLLMKNGRNIPKQEIRSRVETLVDEVGLSEYLEHRPYELSGGQRQRVAIARALVTKPDIVLADEPTANLDSETGNTILEVMQELNEVEQTTFIFSTHDPEVLKYAKNVVKIKDGIIVQ